MKSYDELVKACICYMQEKNLSQVKFASKIGIGESTFSRWIKGNYPNGENIEKKVRDYFDKEEARSEIRTASDLCFVETNISDKVWQVLEYCRLQRTIGVIYGDAGIGKTFTMRMWEKDKSDVIVVTACPAFSSPKPFLKLLSRELKTALTGGVDDIFIDILDKLDGSDKTIVIDEAQHLNRKTLELVRGINDITGVAIILIGNEMVYSKMVGKQQAEFAQLFSRLGMRNHVMTDMFTREDVEGIFEGASDDETDYLLKICRSKYSLRGAVHVYTNSQNNKDVSIKGLKAMSSVMGISV